MKRLFVWLILSLMSITAVMPTFVTYPKQDQNPAVIQVEQEENDDPQIPDVNPIPKTEPTKVVFDDQNYAIVDAYDVFNNETVYNEITQENRNSKLPESYTQIEYLESSGNEWINTEYIATAQTKIETRFAAKQKGGNVCGSYNGFAIQTAGYLYGYIGGVRSGSLAFSTDVLYDVSLEMNGWSVNDETYYPSYKVPSSNYNLYIFSNNDRGNVGNYSSVKLFTFKIYENDFLVHDYVPCFNENGIFGLYDTEGETFYTNKGSGIFNYDIKKGHNLNQNSQGEYEIGSLKDLMYFNLTATDETKKYCLTKDINFNDGYFELNVDGSCTYHDGGDGKLYNLYKKTSNFESFGGNGKTISRFYSSKTSLFYGNGLTIENLKMDGGYIETTDALGFVGLGYDFTCINVEVSGVIYSNVMTSGVRPGGCGMLVGYSRWDLGNSAIFKNCVARGTLTSGNYGDGIASINGKYLDCTNFVNIYATNTFGITHIATEIQNCKNYGDVNVGIANNATLIRDCINFKLKQTGNVYGISGSGSANIENCINYAEVSGADSFTGIANATIITSCKNYGKAICTTKAQGIGSAENVLDCVNYANISAEKDCGGISSGGSEKIVNCINYGNIQQFGSTADESGCGGIVGYSHYNYSLSLYNCVNYGNICGERYAGGLIGNKAGHKWFYRDVNISNCLNVGDVKTLASTASGFLCYTKYVVVKIVNSENLGVIKSGNYGGLFVSLHYNATIIIKNCLSSGNIQDSNDLLTGKGFYVEGREISNTIVYGRLRNNDFKRYFGDNFSAFFITWKENRIGLKALEGVGLYMWTVDEEILGNLGFTKAG